MQHLTRETLVPYLDGELSPAEVARCHAHLRGCPACRQEAASLGQVWDLLDAYPAPVAPADMTRTIIARAQREASVAASPGPGRFARLRRVGVAVAAAAAIALVVAYWPADPTAPADLQRHRFAVVDADAVPQPVPGEVRTIMKNIELLETMQEYGDLIENFETLRALDRVLQDDDVTL